MTPETPRTSSEIAPSQYVERAKLTTSTWTFRVVASTETGEWLLAEFRQRIGAH